MDKPKKIYDAEERSRAIDAIHTLYWLEVIDELTCRKLITKVNRQTGE